MAYASDSHLVIIPTYNEIDNIEEFIIQISNFDVSVLIVDDNSPDGTGKIVDDITKINKFTNLDTNKVLELKNLPISFSKLIEKINLLFLKINYQSKSEVKIKNYYPIIKIISLIKTTAWLQDL